ncbi:LysR family transcriptional regulator [Allostreptomyces psammosilenae]|uniref:DNA-binding transcriptional LysR family regulator n=1 Tax=Allostreptomyces psammosilenae TaxID=1892865 RepID=A0A852ZSN9_9ACTN|nr:LysR family transcriptional regulator [Allostreptomyces psammosilenae]NYI04845.1 DNA-binding transcriptional LysR family regulator [Allostreptomyces psammosilenae]
MDLTRLRLLVELSRLGTMGAVAEATGYRTSAVSKHLAVLEQEVGNTLLVPVGRRVQLTAAGRRLVEHGIGILAAVDAATAELRGDSEPAGLVRIGSFATGAEQVVVPALVELRRERPHIDVRVYEHEPDETVDLLLAGRIEVGVIYDYRLSPRILPAGLVAHPLWEEPIMLAIPAGDGAGPLLPPGEVDVAQLRHLADEAWITNSRGSDDDEAVQRLCALAGFSPRIVHRADSLHLINTMVGAGCGVGLLPRLAAQPERADVALRPLSGVPATRRALLLHRTGQDVWPPIAAVREHLSGAAARLLPPLPDPEATQE